jgi:hypothetical protein
VRTVSGVDYPYATGETYAGTLVITGVGVPTIVMPENRAGRTLDQTRADEQTVWLRHSKSYLLNGTSYLVWLIRRWSGPGFDPATYDDAAAGSWWFADPLPGGYSSPLVTSAAPTPLGIANPLTPYNPGAGGGSGDPLDRAFLIRQTIHQGAARLAAIVQITSGSSISTPSRPIRVDGGSENGWKVKRVARSMTLVLAANTRSPLP